jgi:hypothetical protein
MNLYTTEITAICPTTGELLKWGGPRVPGISFKDAVDYCQRNGLGYCKVTGILVMEIPTKGDKPDFDNAIQFGNHN